jgi:N6-L-threonylcarbamoyladenine synthase
LAEELKYQKDELKIKLPRPMMFTKDYDFSFSGLKTATLYSFKKQPADIQRSKNYIRAMAFEIQEAVIDILVYKTLKAARNFQARSIIAGGGVTANQKLKERFQSEIAKLYTQPRFLAPDKIFSTDNASMIAMAAFFNLDKQTDWKEIQANANLRIK